LALALQAIALRESLARIIVWCAAIVGFVFISFTYVQARRGRPFVRIPEAMHSDRPRE
jgi:hypothetical protein